MRYPPQNLLLFLPIIMEVEMDEHDNTRKVSTIGWATTLGGRVTSKPIQNPKAITKISHGLSPPNLFITLSPFRLTARPWKMMGKKVSYPASYWGSVTFQGRTAVKLWGGGGKPSNQNHTVVKNPWNTEVQGSNQATHRRLKGLIAPWHREFQVVKRWGN